MKLLVKSNGVIKKGGDANVRKYLITLVMILCFLLINGFMGGLGWAGELRYVEKLTDQEKQELSEASKKLHEARENLEAIQDKIAKSHKMSNESWMEWGSWYEINGDYILSYYQSFMGYYSIILK
ncbi:MAG: hypothetical protein A2Z69_00200 [Bacteroidetes bacterium RBG_13_44_24]|nr:MAG: hypothetical protein A2Z69_00200 [Bacteroidetes bacterium RBG_13_44_24]